MELAAQRRNGAAVFVDYAHKPGAVIAALQSLRPHVMGRIVAVIGACILIWVVRLVRGRA